MTLDKENKAKEDAAVTEPKCTCAEPHLLPWWWCAKHGEVTVPMD